jgi:5-methylcytosine-specific restriction endonuclease McrA
MKKYTKELMEAVVEDSVTYSDVFRKLNPGKTLHGGSVDWVKKKLNEFEIDVSHFLGRAWLRNRTGIICRTMPKQEFIEKYLIIGSEIISDRLKRKLIKYKIKEDVCEICGNMGIWNGERLVLQIDHINGIRNDNRLSNLRILCPNCHSQTRTYAGRKNHGENSGQEECL